MSRRAVWLVLRVVLALAVIVAALGCDAIPINLPDPKAGLDGAAPSADSSPYDKLDSTVSPSADVAMNHPDAPAQPWVDSGWSGDAGVPPPPLYDGGPCLDDGGDGGCPPTSDAAPDGEAGVGEAGVDEGGIGLQDGTSNDCHFID